jgi:hypothetical protein
MTYSGRPHPLFFAQRFEHVAVTCLQLIAVALEKALPVKISRIRRPLIERRLALLIRHLEKEQKRQLLDVILVDSPSSRRMLQ